MGFQLMCGSVSVTVDGIVWSYCDYETHILCGKHRQYEEEEEEEEVEEEVLMLEEVNCRVVVYRVQMHDSESKLHRLSNYSKYKGDLKSYRINTVN